MKHTKLNLAQVSPRRENETIVTEDNKVCGINLSSLPRSIQLIVCIIVVFVLFIMYGYCQEWLFQMDGVKKHGMFVTLMQFGFYTIFGIFEQNIHGKIERRVPLVTYIGLAVLTIGTMGLSNTSLGYLNYPTQVIFKSSKLIPVMIGGILIQGKKFSMFDLLSCLLMTIGLIMFTLTDQKVSPNFEATGIILISLALCSDAAIGNIQELTMKKHKTSNAELVLYSYGIGFLILFVGHLVFGGFLEVFIFMIKNAKIMLALFLFSFSGYVGIHFVLHLVRTFGALLAVTVTTCRKAVTMILSFMFFTKPFSILYLWAGMLVLGGICLNIYSKNKSKVDSMISGAVRGLRKNSSLQSNIV
ncbi:adenosine 3'-phospho 5'-phosphosulfate transporter 2-like [Ciona intestinalis]